MGHRNSYYALFIALWLLPIKVGAQADALFTDVVHGGGEAQLFRTQSLVADGCYVRADMQSDGNFVIYKNTWHPYATWSTHTVNSGFNLRMQDDGNLVMYNVSEQPVWSTGTAVPNFTGNFWAIMGSDARLKILDAYGDEHWASQDISDFPQQGPIPCTVKAEHMQVFTAKDFPGNDLYGAAPISQPRPAWCGHLCAIDKNCRAYTYVPPGVQGTTAYCYMKSAKGTAYRNYGMVSGYKVTSTVRSNAQ